MGIWNFFFMAILFTEALFIYASINKKKWPMKKKLSFFYTHRWQPSCHCSELFFICRREYVTSFVAVIEASYPWDLSINFSNAILRWSKNLTIYKSLFIYFDDAFRRSFIFIFHSPILSNAYGWSHYKGSNITRKYSAGGLCINKIYLVLFLYKYLYIKKKSLQTKCRKKSASGKWNCGLKS